jgi:hypothetical protein
MIYNTAFVFLLLSTFSTDELTVYSLIHSVRPPLPLFSLTRGALYLTNSRGAS